MRHMPFLAVLGLLLLGVACGQDTASPTTTPTAYQVLRNPPAEPTVRAAPTATPAPIVTPVPTPTPRPLGSTKIDRRHWGKATASLEERIFLSDVVVKARLTSAGSGTLDFRAIEYLKGTGPTKFKVQAETEGRDTRFDQRDAILFLASLTGETQEFRFVDTISWNYWAPWPERDFARASQYTGNLPVGYTLGANNPVWLPVSPASGSESRTRTAQSSDPNILTEYDRAGAVQSVSQSTLEQTIQWVSPSTTGGSAGRRSADTQTGDGPAYNANDHLICMTAAMEHIRWQRDYYAHHGEPRVGPFLYDTTNVPSGAAQGTQIHQVRFHMGDRDYPPTYSVDIGLDTHELEGRDAHLFGTRAFDINSETYQLGFVTRRPLPGGSYEFKHFVYFAGWKPCNYRARDWDSDAIITVTAPPGTVHEAFFDPATTTAGVGYLAGSATTTGVLEPAGFSMRGRDINITGLEWRNGQVVLSFDRIVQLSDGLSFIETDGTAGLYLSQFDATEDLRARTATWDVPERPWEPGDELMLRMGPIPLPGVRNLTAEANSAGDVVLRWEVAYRAGVNGYRIWRHRPGRDEGPRIYVSDTLSTDTTYTDANSPVPNLTEYRVQAIDRVYNAGESSESVRLGSQ